MAKKERAAAIEKRFADKRAVKQGTRYEEQDSRYKQEPGNKEQGRMPLTAKGVSSSAASSLKPVEHGVMPLNKYLAHCGVASRREAIPYIQQGKVTVNGNVVTEPGFKITDNDEVVFNGKKLFVTRNQVYILLNKPKDYITTKEDPQGRRTVFDLVKHATNERIYPVGRLDRNTTGVLIFTNDGELTQKMTHPSYEIKKVYEVKLDKPLTKSDFDKIVKGIKLEDGEVHADVLAYADSKDRSIIGIEIHSGRNRIVRRIFESLGYDVKGLDRVMYANLTKKNVERGKWRFLSEKEIRLLKHMKAGQEGKGNVSKNKND